MMSGSGLSEFQNFIGEKRMFSVCSAPEDSQEIAKNATADLKQRSNLEEVGGRGGLDPVRYGDWEKDGRCIDF
ncbi:DUF1674 domain-containing protein [Xylella fastidiosa subsp. fastidiosa]|uniref:DUF1674 domain-containing protein n=4 Tax=Xylella fastidiosa TaxID=2371 RepID=Q87EG2_XYLFT|nr:DUF1674 domain-containing protein [Xylella fastidiosa]AAO28229.1 conserved hypothetical protein [Xylella fastidiosa Temecula1]ACB91789.1 protein of unknown function DUF1674 [Xylella fastidiosa M23]AIC11926.1 hypothetical protein P303_01205 [Xylella fastidiosa MUL0034]KAF0571265.1 hypothetical protein P305_05450 [Xylella fastidiosa subsp. fastidiosa Mus-1]KGM21141.1 hypothetical protein JT24_01945 [Xylella fastidiosa]